MLCAALSVVCAIFGLFFLYKILDKFVRVPRISRCGDRYILVTGCAKGFGLEAVRRFDSLGCHVFAGCRRKESVLQLEEMFSDRVYPIHLDITNRESVQEAFKFVSSNLPKGEGIWGLVNNAGIVEILPLELINVSMYERILSTNLYGTIDVTMTFLPLVKRARGRIVNVSSYGGRIALPIFTHYCVSKYALEAFTDGLRRSLRPYGCKALIVEPGSAKTEILSVEGIVEEFDAAWRRNRFEKGLEVKEGEQLLQIEREKLMKLMGSYSYIGSISNVIDAYEHALFGVYPRARYVVGIDAKAFLLLQLLPEWLSDWILCSKMPKFQC